MVTQDDDESCDGKNWTTFFIIHHFTSPVIRSFFQRWKWKKIHTILFILLLFFDNEKTLKKFHDTLQHSTVVPPRRDCAKLESVCNFNVFPARRWIEMNALWTHHKNAIEEWAKKAMKINFDPLTALKIYLNIQRRENTWYDPAKLSQAF